MSKGYKYIGQNIPNDQAYGKVTGATKYCADLASPRALRMKLKHGDVAHGIIKSIDTEAAWKVPGVRAIYTCFNTPEREYDRGRVSINEGGFFQERLFNRHVRYMGERVAAVVADTVQHAEMACDLIQVEYEVLPGAYTIEQALAEDAPEIYEGGNVVPMEPIVVGDYEAVDGIMHTSKSHISRMSHMVMDTHAARCIYDKAEGKLTVWTGTQTVFGVRSTLGDFLEMPYSKIRVIKPAMGGSFGCKQETVIEPLAAYAAVNLGAEVLLDYTREEQVNDSMMKHNVDFDVETKMGEDGSILGLKMFITLDAGAYMATSLGYISTIAEKIGKVYDIPNLLIEGKVVYTNTSMTGSFRSWGSSEISVAVENHLNKIARETGVDTIALRHKNVHEPYDIDRAVGITIGKTHFHEVIEQGCEKFGWKELKEKCQELNAEQGRYRYGIGVSLASHTSCCYPYHIDIAGVTMRIQEDGSVIVHTAVHDHGAGSVLALKKMAAEVLGVDIERITLTEADTENDCYDYGCFASRTTYLIGEAVRQCALDMIDYMMPIAAKVLGCSGCCRPEYDCGVFTCCGKTATLRDIAMYCLTDAHTDLFVHTEIKSQQNPGADCAHFSMVQVDTMTGHVKVKKALSVHDVGKAINPDLCFGQVSSGVQQGMGVALCEEIPINPETGETLVKNFKDYHIANAGEMPDIDVLFIEDGDDYGPYGAKSLGEAGLAPVAPAIVAAVNDALGTDLSHLPLTPAKILDALIGEVE